jgi:hypothetical protein
MTITAQWTKSTHSSNNTTCVETRLQEPGVAVRDSKDTRIPGFAITPKAWEAFLTGITKK